jgi:site-specific DNA-methyltransferase (adenine-specific)
MIAISTRIEHGDCLEVIPRLIAEGVQVDAVVTDPPYHLIQIARSLRLGDSDGTRSATRPVRDAGFMGQQWDGGDIAFRPETWATVATIMRPGAFLVAFGGTRTYHRLACAIEDGGFVIQDCIMWLFATGFPKRRDMLKPAYEPIVLAYKPGGKRTMQVDECRIAMARDDGWDVPRMSFDGDARVFGSNGRIDDRSTPHTAGRWPANICHDGSDEVIAAFPDSAGAVSNGRSGVAGIYEDGVGPAPQLPSFGDTGSAARFFFSAKAGVPDRWGSRHPTVKPVELMKWLVALVTPPGATLLDPFAGSGSTGVAALATGRDAILVEREDAYIADIRERMAHYAGDGRHSLASKGRHAADKVGTLI